MTPQQPGQPIQGMQPLPGGPQAQPPGAGAPPMQPPMEQQQPEPNEAEGGPEDQADQTEVRLESAIDQFMAQTNLAKKFRNKKTKDGSMLLEEMGEEIVKGYELDEDSRKEWSKKNVEWRRLALLIREDKTFPWPKASNAKYPLLATAAMQFSARAYPSLVPSDGKIVKTRAIPYDPQGEVAKRAEHIAKHMSYQVMCQMPNWEEDMDKLLLTMAISGICYKKTYHDAVLGVHRSDLVYPENLCVNYWAKDLQSAYRKTELLYYNDNEIREKKNNDEEFLDIELQAADPSDTANSDNLTKKLATGNTASINDDATPCNFLDCHTFWDLDGDGYEEPYIITVHKASKKVVRIIARWELDGVKKDPHGKIIRIVPLEYFTPFPFIPNPDGSIYALGFGLLLGSINESVNSIVNQLIDAGTLHNLQSGFVGKGLRLKMGGVGFTPGEWKVVNATGDDLKKQIVPLPTKEPSAVLLQLLQLLITSGNQLASIAEIFVGKMPGQNTPATTTQETVKQGMAVFTAIYKRVYRALEQEFKKVFRLNRITDGILEDENKILGLQLTESDYDNDNLIIPGGDPTGDSTATKQAKVNQVGQMLSLGTIDPMAFTAWALETGEIPNYQQLLKQPAPPPPPDPKVQTEQLKQQTEQLKQEGMKQKQAGDQQQGQTKLQVAQGLAAIKVQSEQSKLEHQQTSQAMNEQGAVTGHLMETLGKVNDQRYQTQTQQQHLAHTDAANAQALEHASAMGKIKQTQAAAPKPKGKTKK